ncbi:hypothetical protein AAEX37_02354 [Oligella sp. MSHR50489EDL]|uniref:HIT family protein n=1 Tax=Oligella sp. MSHR50489EDL TaxID=3139409 RepID=UPI003D817F6F
MTQEQHCVLCREVGGRLLWQNDFVRIINAEEPNYPAFTRVILQAHVKEMSDLAPAQRQALMDFVWLVEMVQREVLAPAKINLAQFGTMVPHVHWHIIPRFSNDPHYPDAVWSQPKNSVTDTADTTHRDYLANQQKMLAQYEAALINRLKSINN